MRFSIAVASLATLWACGEATTTVPPADLRDVCEAESVSITPAGLGFGRLIPTTRHTRTATLTYQGCTGATLELSVDGLLSTRCDRGAFCLEETPALELEPGASVALPIRFQPASPGVALGGLSVTGCPTRRCKADLLLQGSAEETGLICYPDPVDFGIVAARTCATRRIDCTNVVDRPVSIDRILMLEDSSPELTASASAPADLAPEASIGIDLRYCPGAEGPDLGTLLVASTVAGRTASISIGLFAQSGGGRLDLPDTIDFGLVSLIAPARRPIRVTNIGVELLHVFGLQTEPPFGSAAGAASLIPGQASQVWVSVQALVEGPLEGVVEIYSDDPVRPVRTVRALAEGVNLAPCEISLSETELDFGAVPLGEVAARDVIVANEGELDCVVTSAALTNLAPAFEVPDAHSVRVQPGSNASIAVKFSPTGTITPDRATLEIGISSPIEPYRRVQLIGHGQ